MLLAVPAEVGLLLERPIEAGIIFDSFASDGSSLGQVVTGADGQSEIQTSTAVRDNAQTLRQASPPDKRLVVLVHRPDEVERHFGGDRQRELRRALGALEEDPAQLETLLKLTEKVIFDSDDAGPELVVRLKVESKQQETPELGPESLAVDAAGRSVRRKKRRLASGDILVLLDALMHRLGEGLPGTAPPRAPIEEVRPVDNGDLGEEETPPLPQYEILAEACRGKVGRLVRRMAKQLQMARSSGARRAVVQLAAVLSVVHTLRIMEQRTEWRSKHLNLVAPEHERLLLETGGLALAWGGSSLSSRAVTEADGEPFQELSMAITLLAWLAWDVGIDVKAAVERTAQPKPDKENAPWRLIQIFAVVATQLAGDLDARDALGRAMERTPRKGADVAPWLAAHLGLADRLIQVVKQPEGIVKADRAPRAGDLVILGPAFDPRVRVALALAPSSAGSDKITVFDRDSEAGDRQFLATCVDYLPWWEKEKVPGALSLAR